MKQYRMNTILLIFIGLLFGVLASHFFELSLKKNIFLRKKYYRRHLILFSHHIHHSMYGIVCIVAGFLTYLNHHPDFATFLFATGIGIIIMHTIFDGRLIFVEKEKSK